MSKQLSKLQSQLASALCLALSAAAPALHAEEKLPEFKTGEIVVSGETTGVEQVTTVRSVVAEDIRQRGARTLDEALALLPGVNIRTGGDGTPRIQIRGLETRHVKLLLDGIPLNSTLDGNFDPTMIPVEQIARIKLSAGSSSMLYGDGDLGGAINIITRKGSGAVHVSGAGIEAGEGRMRRAWGSLSGASGGMDYFLSASRQERDGFRLSGDFKATALEDGGVRNNSDSARTHLYANVGLAANDGWSLGLTARHTDGDHGLPPSTLGTTDPFAAKAKYERMSERADALQLSAEYAPGSAWSGRGWLYYNGNSGDDDSYDNTGYNSISNAKLNNTFMLHNDTRIGGGHLQSTYRTPVYGALTLALDGRKEHWDSAGTVHDVSVAGGNFKARSVSYGRDIGVQSAAVEYAVAPIARLEASAGYSRYRQTRDDDTTQSANGYLLGLAYALSDSLGLRAATSQHVRFPTISQLYDATAGEAGLKTETARNREVGVTQKLGQHTLLSLAVFHNDVYNYIEKDDASNKYRNFAHYRFTGAEANGETRVGARLGLRASFAHLQSDNLSPGAAFEQLQYRPRNKASFEANYDFGLGLSANATLLAVADQHYYSRTTPTQQALLNNYSLLNFKLSQRLPGKGASVYVGANNLLNKNYETAYGFPQAGRLLYAGLEYSM